MTARLASVFLQTAQGVMVWRRPDEYAPVSFWRRAVVSLCAHIANVLVRL